MLANVCYVIIQITLLKRLEPRANQEQASILPSSGEGWGGGFPQGMMMYNNINDRSHTH